MPGQDYEVTMHASLEDLNHGAELEVPISGTETDTEGADVVVVSYGISARTSWKAIRAAQRKGLKVGQLKLDSIWPFPEENVR